MRQYAASPVIQTLVADRTSYFPNDWQNQFYDNVWNISTAVGFGLDIWGRIIGVSRSINVPSDTPNPGGFTFVSGVYQMTDSEYRTVLLIKALSNITTCTAKDLNKLLTKLFVGRGRCYVNDVGSMTMRFTLEFYLYPFEYVILTQSGAAPRPAGVLLTIIQVDPTKTFGFAEALQFQPFDQGTFYVS
jgi:hypothetical protein